MDWSLDITGASETIILQNITVTKPCSTISFGGSCHATRHRLSCPPADDGVYAGHAGSVCRGRRVLLPYRGQAEGYLADSRRLCGTRYDRCLACLGRGNCHRFATPGERLYCCDRAALPAAIYRLCQC